jgi:hypothetical protein
MSYSIIGLSAGETMPSKNDSLSAKEEPAASSLAPHVGDMVHGSKDAQFFMNSLLFPREMKTIHACSMTAEPANTRPPDVQVSESESR